MVLPTKHLRIERSLVGIAADLIGLLKTPKSESQLWQELISLRKTDKAPLTFDWYVLALSMLFALGAIELRTQKLYLRESSD